MNDLIIGISAEKAALTDVSVVGVDYITRDVPIVIANNITSVAPLTVDPSVHLVATSAMDVAVVLVQPSSSLVPSPVSGYGLGVYTTAAKSRGVSRGTPTSPWTLTGTLSTVDDDDPAAHSLGIILFPVWPSIALALNTLADNDPSFSLRMSWMNLLPDGLVFLTSLFRSLLLFFFILHPKCEIARGGLLVYDSL